MNIEQLACRGADYLFDTDQLEVKPHVFNPQWLTENECVTAQFSSGRGVAWCFRLNDKEYVLKPFRRGGLVAKFNAGHYLYLGLERSRAFREFRLLTELSTLRLPVPAPVAARVQRRAFYYTCDLISERLPAAPLTHLLSLSEDVALGKAIGQLVAKFHSVGLDHPDLNPSNILYGNTQLYLIDFDGARLHHCAKQHGVIPWRQANLRRFRRAVIKHFGPVKSDQLWQSVLAGYWGGC